MTQEEFITKSKEKFGNYYDYSKIDYQNCKKKIILICPKHGEFLQTPEEHLKCKIPCPRCGRRIMDNQAFLEVAKEVHGDKYDYSKIGEITKSSQKITIVCTEHGDFEQTVNSHLNGRGCPICAGKKFSLKNFIKKANQIWNNKYDYSKTKYRGYGATLVITCPKHGDFEQLPNNHLKGECGCLQCRGKEKDFEKISSTETLIKKAKAKFGDKFDYSKTQFTNSREKIIVTCPVHGDFSTLPYQFLQNNFGCPQCNDNRKSHGELLIQNILTKYNIKYRCEVPITTKEIIKKSNQIRVDFLLVYNNFKYIIEYNGEQHYKYNSYMHNNDINNFYLQQKRDQILRDICELNKDKVKLLEIPYTTKDNEIENIILKFIEYMPVNESK